MPPKVDGSNESSQTTVTGNQGQTSAMMIGVMEPYVIGESVEEYLERLENYLELNEIKDDKKKVMLLLNLLGKEASHKVTKACLPEKPTDHKYEKVLEMCRKAFLGEKNLMVEHYRFNARSQKSGEPFYDFSIELSMLAKECEFGAFRETALRDRFVAGIRDQEVKAKLLSLGSKTTFKAVVEEAMKMEMIAKDVKSMGVPDEVNRVGSYGGRARFSRRGRRKFDRSRGRSGYRSKSRGQKSNRCYNCDGEGHFARNCPSRKRARSSSPGYDGAKRSSRGNMAVKQVQEEDELVGKLNVFNFGGDAAIRKVDGVAKPNKKAEYDEDMEDLEKFLSAEEEKMKILKNKTANLEIYSILGTSSRTNECERIKLNVEGKEIQFEVDTGAVVSVCSSSTYRQQFFHLRIQQVEDFPLCGASGSSIAVQGGIVVRLEFKGKTFKLPIVVIQSEKPLLLLGRNWLDRLYQNWRQTFRINSLEESYRQIIEKIKTDYREIFDQNISEPIRQFEAEIQLENGAVPIVHKPYNVPLSLREKVEQELDRLCKAGIIQKVRHSKWASPIVVVPKPDGKIRMCGNYAVTVNPHIRTDHYRIPVIDELLHNVSGYRYYVVLDLKGAYMQVKLSQNSREILTITTHKGLFQFLRLPFGVKPASQIFQAIMDSILQGIPNIFSYIDDLIIGANSIEELMSIVRQVLDRLKEYNVKVNWDKCHWFCKRVLFLGHILSRDGINPNPEKIKAIVEAPSPENTTQLKSFVGLVNYYSKFVAELSVMLRPFYDLLKKGAKWEWSEDCQRTFEKCKKALVDARILCPYDPRKPMVLVCDASDQGISAIGCHIVDGVERPFHFASRVLSPAEKKYPILHREALAIVFGLESFSKFLYGYPIKIFTDHKPLLGIFNKRACLKTGIVAARLQRYMDRIAHFDFEVFYRVGSKNVDADCLSRLPIPENRSEADKKEENISIKSIGTDGEITLNLETIKKYTNQDKVLMKVKECVLNGWPKSGVPKSLKSYFSLNDELEIVHEVLAYKERILIPDKLKNKTLNLLHSNHAGVVRMKELARKYVFWLGINKDIEDFVRTCESCQRGKNDKQKVYGTWPESKFPFERTHLDFFYFHGKYFLIFVDSYSKWLDVKLMRDLTARNLIRKLQEIFDYFGYAKQLVTDNGPPYGSYEFSKFCEKKGITLTHTPPYHPSSNGLAERSVQTVKSVLKKLVFDAERHNNLFGLEDSISDFLRKHRNMPVGKGDIPAHKVFSYSPRWELDAIKLPFNQGIPQKSSLKKSQESSGQKKNQKVRFEENFDKSERPKKVQNFKKGEIVWYLSNLNGKIYRYEGTIVRKITEHIYEIEINRSKKLVHLNQIQKKFGRDSRKPIYQEMKFDRKILERNNSFDRGTFAEVVASSVPVTQPSIRESPSPIVTKRSSRNPEPQYKF